MRVRSHYKWKEGFKECFDRFKKKIKSHNETLEIRTIETWNVFDMLKMPFQLDLLSTFSSWIEFSTSKLSISLTFPFVILKLIRNLNHRCDRVTFHVHRSCWCMWKKNNIFILLQCSSTQSMYDFTLHIISRISFNYESFL